MFQIKINQIIAIRQVKVMLFQIVKENQSLNQLLEIILDPNQNHTQDRDQGF